MDLIWDILEQYDIIKEDRWDFVDPATGDAFRLKERAK